MSILCLLTSHRFTNSTGLFQKSPYCLRCGKTIGNVSKDTLDNHEAIICNFVTRDQRICRKETVRALIDSLKEAEKKEAK